MYLLAAGNSHIVHLNKSKKMIDTSKVLASGALSLDVIFLKLS